MFFPWLACETARGEADCFLVKASDAAVVKVVALEWEVLQRDTGKESDYFQLGL